MSALPLRAAEAAKPFSFILLGDLHFDRWEHHDRKWLEEKQVGDIRQIENYTRLTREVMPLVFDAIRTRIAALRLSPTPPAFVLQVGDLVEGLCGSAALSTLQNREALDFVTKSDLGIPFLFTKGNHDVTGDGAVEAFNDVLLPFMTAQSKSVDTTASHTKACHLVTHGDSQFAFFDAYEKTSLEWLEAVAAKRTTDHFFVTIHPPVVPYGARATWHLFAKEKEAAQRAKLLEILGTQEAVVLGGHLHKFSSLTRLAGGKRFTQLAVSSVVSAPDQKPKDILHGLDAYTGDQVKLEPNHSPETTDLRRAVYATERQQVTAFDYADAAGYAVVTVNGEQIEATVHNGTRADIFQTVRLAG